MIIVWVPGLITLNWYNVTLLILAVVIALVMAEFVVGWLTRRW